jgi:hypothetical protein
MKKLLTLAAAVLALASVNAHAVNTAGVWKGTGTITSKKANKTTACESITVTIAHTATLLKVDSAFVCQGDKGVSPGGVMEIRNGSELWEKGVRVGTITPNSVTISVKDAEHTLETKTNFTDKEMTFNVKATYASMPGEELTFVGKVQR